MNVYVGNLASDTSEADLRDKFEPFGAVASIQILKDKVSGRPIGFGFIEMPDDAQAEQAILKLDRTKIKGRTVIVCPTKARSERRKTVRQGSKDCRAAEPCLCGPDDASRSS